MGSHNTPNQKWAHRRDSDPKCSLLRLRCSPAVASLIFGREHWDVWDLRAHLGIVSHDLQHEYVAYAKGLSVVLSGYYSSVGTWAHQHFSEEQLQCAEQVITDRVIAAIRQKMFAEMSTGHQRRFLLGRALVKDPDTLVLDEPTGGVDLEACFHYLDVIRGLMQHGKTVILVTTTCTKFRPRLGTRF